MARSVESVRGPVVCGLWGGGFDVLELLEMNFMEGTEMNGMCLVLARRWHMDGGHCLGMYCTVTGA